MPPKRHLGDMFYVTLNLSSHTLYEIGEDLMHTHDYLSIHIHFDVFYPFSLNFCPHGER